VVLLEKRGRERNHGMDEKRWKEMNGREKAWKVTKITGRGVLIIVAGVLAIVAWLLGKGGQGPAGRRRYPSRGGGSVWTVGSGGKKPGSWSSGRHK